MKLLLPLFILLSYTSSVYGQQLSGLPFMRYYSSQDYEGGIQNWAITQNNEGLIYVANNFGVLEFDGTNWKRHILPAATKTRDVLISRNGRLNVASQGDFGFLNPTSTGTLQYTSLADSLPAQYRNFDETWRIFEHEDELIFCTFKQIFIFKNDQLSKIIDPRNDPENFYFVNNTLYINQLETGLSYLRGDSLYLFHKGEFFQGKTITGIIPLANNHLWLSTLNNGIFTYDGQNYRPWNKQQHITFINAAVNVALRLRNGNMAIGTQNDGLFITDVNGRILQHLTKGHGLNNRTILAMYEDVMGNLWLGHNNGLTCVELGLPFAIISEQSGLPGTGYDAYLKEEELYLGTNNGLYTKDLSTPLSTDYTFMEGTEGQVYHIDNIDNQIMIGHHQGTFALKDTKAEQLSDVLGSWTFLKLKQHPGYILVGTYKGLLLFSHHGQSIKLIRKLKGFEESSRVMEEDQYGNIWMTHGYKGVYKLRLNDALDSISARYYGVKDGLPSNMLINVWNVSNKLLFSTASGIYRYDQSGDRFVMAEDFRKYLEGTPSISYMEQDPMGNIYYLASEDIGVLEKQPNGGYIRRSRIFNRIKGMLNDDLQNLSVLHTQHVLYGAKEGFILYTKGGTDPSEQPFNTLIRKVSVTSNKDSVIANGYYTYHDTTTNLQPQGSFTGLPFAFNSLRIEYSAPYFHSTTSTQYRYKLVGQDSHWSEWTSKTDKEYTNLPEGDYHFQVQARNIYDQLSELASYHFVILPPWYRTPTAYFSFAFGILLILFMIFYLFHIRHQKEKRLMVLRQAKEINRMDSELRSSEEQVQQLKNEKLKAAVESKNKELATSTMHLLNKNSFINSVKHDISTISKRSRNQEVKKELAKIMSNIEKNIAEDDDWEHFAIHFDQVHGDFTRRLQDTYSNLTPQEMKLSAYLRMNLSTKEIAHLLNISVRGVEIARYRLRKKLSLERSTNLQEFILKY